MITDYAKSIEELQAEVSKLRSVLGTTIVWIAQSAGSPLSKANAKELLGMIDKPATVERKPLSGRTRNGGKPEAKRNRSRK